MLLSEHKKEQLTGRLREETRRPVCLALSGGVDSGLLAALIGKYAGENHTTAYGVTFDTVLHPPADLEAAHRTAEECGLQHHVIRINEMEQEEIRNNPKDRCYLCKKQMFSRLKRFAQEQGAEAVFEGTNLDDLKEYRPGIRAIRELGIFSPWAEYGFTKEEIRTWAAELGISVAKRPAAPCMATRLPYGARLEPSLLKRIEEGERQIRELGFPVVRLRVHGEIVRIEVPFQQFELLIRRKEEITKLLKALDFKYITADLEGFRSGSMDL